MALRDSKCLISMIIQKNLKLWTAFQECVILVTQLQCALSRTRVKFGGQICHQWNSRFSFSSTKTTMCVVTRRFRSREVCFTWRNWRLTCTATQRVTTCCISVACGVAWWIHDWCTEGCLCDHLVVVKVGKFMIYLSVTILTWVSIVMKLKWMWECGRVWES